MGLGMQGTKPYPWERMLWHAPAIATSGLHRMYPCLMLAAMNLMSQG